MTMATDKQDKVLKVGTKHFNNYFDKYSYKYFPLCFNNT